MKRTLLTLFAAAALVTSASATNYLHIRTASGYDLLDLDQVDHLTFTGGLMQAHDSDGSVVKSYPQEELMTVNVDQSTGIGSIDSDKTAMPFTVTGRTLSVITAGDFAVHSLKGETLAAIPGVAQGETVSLRALQPGIYIIGIDGNNVKVTIR